MTTLVAVYNSKRCIGRCDAKCYAWLDQPRRHKVRCTCICGGRNHGAGETLAISNVRAGIGLAHADLALFADKHRLRCEEIVAIDRLIVPDAEHARELAYLKLHQLELPFEAQHAG